MIIPEANCRLLHLVMQIEKVQDLDNGEKPRMSGFLEFIFCQPACYHRITIEQFFRAKSSFICVINDAGEQHLQILYN